MFSSEKGFKLWEYTVSHSTLLIRYHHIDLDYNLDIVFSSVFYMDLPNSFQGLALAEPTLEEEVYLLKRCGKEKELLPAYKFYVLISDEKRHFIGASYCGVYENDWSIKSGLMDYWNKSGQARLLFESLNPSAQKFYELNDDQ